MNRYDIALEKKPPAPPKGVIISKREFLSADKPHDIYVEDISSFFNGDNFTVTLSHAHPENVHIFINGKEAEITCENKLRGWVKLLNIPKANEKVTAVYTRYHVLVSSKKDSTSNFNALTAHGGGGDSGSSLRIGGNGSGLIIDADSGNIGIGTTEPSPLFYNNSHDIPLQIGITPLPADPNSVYMGVDLASDASDVTVLRTYQTMIIPQTPEMGLGDIMGITDSGEFRPITDGSAAIGYITEVDGTSATLLIAGSHEQI